MQVWWLLQGEGAAGGHVRHIQNRLLRETRLIDPPSCDASP